ncbi:MAG: hypothetical protein F6K41_02095 [Symploca sp. SIO3E6]|nr:hypothetical protein [Caldora sp. SIO3E6]
MSEKKSGERRSGGAEEEERTDNFWIQSSRNPTQNFVHPLKSTKRGLNIFEQIESSLDDLSY